MSSLERVRVCLPGGQLPATRPDAIGSRDWDILVRYVAHAESLQQIAGAHGLVLSRVGEVAERTAERIRETAEQPAFAQLSVRVRNLLRKYGYYSPDRIAATTDDDLLRCRHLGAVGLAEIRRVIPFQSPDRT